MQTTKHHILYVEDHDDTRELVTFALSEQNYRLTTSSNIEDALRLAHAQDFDLYLLDSWLPDGSGVELCKRLREFDRRTPIMFFSAAAYECDKQAAIDSGAQRYLVKPADLDELCTEVGTLLGSAKQERPMEAFPLGHPGFSVVSNDKPRSSRSDPTAPAM